MGENVLFGLFSEVLVPRLNVRVVPRLEPVIKLFIRVWLGFSNRLQKLMMNGKMLHGWTTMAMATTEGGDDDDDDGDGGRRRGNLVERFRPTDASVTRRFGR